MPHVQISVPAGSLSQKQKATMIEKVTDAVVEAEGIPVRPVVVVNILEVPDGGWGSGGKAVTLADLQAAYRK